MNLSRLLPVCLLLSPLLAEDQAAETVFSPEEVGAADFSALRGQSPFLRSLNLSDSLILTGFALVEDEQVATIINKETKQTYVVSSTLNSQGWKMVELNNGDDLERAAVKVAMDGGEVVTVRYAKWEGKPGEAKPAPGPSTEPNGAGPTAIISSRRSRGGDGRRWGGGPPSEMRERMGQLSDTQRQQLFDKMRELREKNPEMSREDRSRLFNEAMDKMLQSKK